MKDIIHGNLLLDSSLKLCTFLKNHKSDFENLTFKRGQCEKNPLMVHKGFIKVLMCVEQLVLARISEVWMHILESL